MKNQICTILGGGGFIGRYLVRNLTKKNYRCIITTRNTFQKGYLKTQAPPGAVELIAWNTNNLTELKEAIKNYNNLSESEQAHVDAALDSLDDETGDECVCGEKDCPDEYAHWTSGY